MRLRSYQHLRLPNFSVHALCAVLQDAGLDWKAALAEADLSPAAVARPGGTIPARKELAFQLQFVALTRGRVDLWIRAAHSYTPGSFGVRGLAFVTAPTVEAWVEVGTGMDYGPGLMEVAPLRAADGQMAGMEITYPDAPVELIPFSVYRDTCSVARNLSWLYGEPFPFTRVEVPLTEVSPEMQEHIHYPIDVDSDALRICWDPATSLHALPFGDRFHHETWMKADRELLESLRRTGDWPETVARAIRSAPALNRSLSNTATALRVTPRTLQRRLAAAKTDFAQVRDDTLSALASELLSTTDHSVARISRLLGYAESSSFSIAFRRWTGLTPTAFRDSSVP